MKTFSVLASLARAANPWLSKATCPCIRALYGIVGVSPNLLSISTSSLSLIYLELSVSSAHGYVFIRTLVDPRRMRDGYGTCSVVRSFVHSFIHSVHRATESSVHFFVPVKV